MNERIVKTMNNLKKNNMQSFYLENKEEVIPLLDKLIIDNETVSVGGSQTLFEIGAIEYLRKRKINFLDRYEEGLNPNEIKEVFRKSFFSDVYLTSTNAITEDGFLYNVDGRGNRVAAMLYGPDKVLVIAGVNKIVSNVNEAIKRVESHSAPLNAKRLQLKTPCVVTNTCNHCDSKEKICRNYVLIKNPFPDRIIVILVNENLGY